MLPACRPFALIGGRDADLPAFVQGAVLTKSKLSLEFVTDADATWIGVFDRNDRNSLAPSFFDETAAD